MCSSKNHKGEKIGEDLVSELRVSPNPSRGDIEISFPDHVIADYLIYKLIDQNGNEVFETSMENLSKVQNLQFENISAGFYLLHIYSEDGNYNWTQKLSILGH